MKDLITIFNYSPDDRRKKILHDLILDLQDLKEDFDILVVSHSPISDITLDLIDYFYYDKNNELLTDFDLTNKFSWEITSKKTFEYLSISLYDKLPAKSYENNYNNYDNIFNQFLYKFITEDRYNYYLNFFN